MSETKTKGSERITAVEARARRGRDGRNSYAAQRAPQRRACALGVHHDDIRGEAYRWCICREHHRVRSTVPALTPARVPRMCVLLVYLTLSECERGRARRLA